MTEWEQTPRVLYITGNTPDICTLWRCWWPCLELTARGYVADYVKFGDLPSVASLLEYGRYNTVVTPRMTFEAQEHEDIWFKFIDTYRNNVKWWYDIDDDLISDYFIDRQVQTTRQLSPTTPVDEVIEKAEFQRDSRLRLIAAVDGTTVGSGPLMYTVDPYCPGNICTVPNGINQRFFDQHLDEFPRTMKELTIGWSGGPRLECDLDPLYDVWPVVAERYPDVHFFLQGWAPDRLARAIAPERMHVVGGVAIEHYPSALRNIDVFCCVATDDPFVLAKTPIKWYEASLAGSSCVASDNVYGSVVDHELNGYVARTTQDWILYLGNLIENAELRATMQAKAREKILSQNTTRQTYEYWLEAWSTAL